MMMSISTGIMIVSVGTDANYAVVVGEIWGDNPGMKAALAAYTVI